MKTRLVQIFCVVAIIACGSLTLVYKAELAETWQRNNEEMQLQRMFGRPRPDLPKFDYRYIDYDAFNFHWADNKEALERFARIAKAGDITDEIVQGLELISRRDKNGEVRRTASDMYQMFRANGNFTGTEAYTAMLKEHIRLDMKLVSDIPYNPADAFIVRLRALRKVATTYTPEMITPALLTDLRTIAQEDDEHRIRQEVTDMLRAYGWTNDFQYSMANVDGRHEARRLSIKLKSNLPYNPKADSTVRLDQLERYHRNYGVVGESVLADLWTIASNDDNQEVAGLASMMWSEYGGRAQ